MSEDAESFRASGKRGPDTPLRAYGGEVQDALGRRFRLRPPASGVRSWGLFLDLTQRQRFRPTEKATRAAQVLRALEHLRGLLSLPRKGMRLAGDERQLAATAVAAAIRGLSWTGDQFFTPDPAITRRRLTQIIPHKCCNDEFAPGSAASWMSF